MTVQVQVSISDELLNVENGDAAKRVLEEFALEGYKSGQLTSAQVSRLLGFSSRYETDGFLKSRGVEGDYTIEDFEQDLATLRKVRAEGKPEW